MVNLEVVQDQAYLAVGIAVPQDKGQLQSIWSLVHQQLLNADLLLSGQFALFAMATNTNPRIDGAKAATLVLLLNHTDV